MFRHQLRKLTKVAYRHRGSARFAEYIRALYSGDAGVFLIRDFDSNLLFYCELDEHIGSHIFWKGYYSEDELFLLDRLLTPRMIFIDVGAHHGVFTVFAAKRLTGGRVFAFEPSLELFRKLERNVNANSLSNVTLIQKGLGDRDCRAALYTADNRFTDGTRNEGLPTLYPTNIRSRFYGEVELISLDDYVAGQNLTRIDVVKIDIEGAELLALRGAVETIKRFKPVILIEVNEETSRAAGYPCGAIVDYLAGKGYRFESINRRGTTQPLTPGQLGKFQNIVCWPKS